MAKELYGLKILVVDDDKDTLELLEWVLKRAGAEVTAVSSAKAAMEALERDRPTILVSDIAMPEEDGLGLMRRIRAGIEAGSLADVIAEYGRSETEPSQVSVA